MYSKFLVFAGLLTLAPKVWAQENVIERTLTPEWVNPSDPIAVPDNSQGVVYVRAQDTIVNLTSKGQQTYQRQMVRILQPQALQAGNIGITWNPAAGSPKVHALRIYRGSRVIDVLDQTAFEILRREDQLEAATLDGLLTASLQVPDLRVGDDLEIAFTLPSHDPTLGEASSGLLALVDAPVGGRFRLELKWEDGQKPITLVSPDLAEASVRSANTLSVSFDDPATVIPPRDAPPRFAWTRIIEYSDFADWLALSRRFEDLFGKAATLAADSPLREEAAIIAETHSGELARAQAALKLVQQQVRYVYVGLNGGNYTPATADVTWQRRYGDCKGKTAMLLALLSELGIAAEAVLVSNTLPSDGFDQRLANPGLFDHVIVRAEIGGEDWWFDPTMPPEIEARTRPLLPYQWVLPLTLQGSAIERLPDTPYDLAQEMGVVEIDARGGFDSPARMVQTTVARGAAGLQQHFQFSSVSANQLEAFFIGQLSGSQQWDEIEKVEYRFDRATQASILIITGTGPVDWDEGSDGYYSLVLPGGGFSPPARRQRPASQGEDIPYFQALDFTCYATTVRLPEGTDFGNWGFNTVFDTMLFGRLYYRMMELRDDRTLRMVRASRVEDPEITSDRAERDNGRIDDFDNSKAVLSFEPGGMGVPWGSLQAVPASYEIDWTSAEAPCLPPDMLED